MEQSLFVLLFFTGVAPIVLFHSRRYYLVQESRTWDDARSYCKAKYMDLAIIKSTDDMLQFQNEAVKQKFNSSAWIGIYNDIDSWRWSLGSESLGNMSKWAIGQPNNNFGMQNCGAVIPIGWDDRICTEKYPFVCLDGMQPGTIMYIYNRSKLMWSEAQSSCRQYYTDLASTRDETEYSVVLGKTTALSYYTWIGLFRDSWKWVDQTELSNIAWESGSPNNALKNESCGYINNNLVADAPCSDLKPFFCYADVTRKKQTIRMKIRSNQDVSAFKTAILEKIKQKLKDNGMVENITLKWRVIRKGDVSQGGR